MALTVKTTGVLTSDASDVDAVSVDEAVVLGNVEDSVAPVPGDPGGELAIGDPLVEVPGEVGIELEVVEPVLELGIPGLPTVDEKSVEVLGSTVKDVEPEVDLTEIVWLVDEDEPIVLLDEEKAVSLPVDGPVDVEEPILLLLLGVLLDVLPELAAVELLEVVAGVLVLELVVDTSEGIADADVRLAGVDALVTEEVDGDWLLGVPPGVEAPDKEEVELDDNEPEPEKVELEPVVEEGALVEEPGEMVLLVEVPREEVLEATLEVPVDVDAVPFPEAEGVLLDD
ncbi:hypothetical protein CPLU01_09058 [Colletotrichum plurivorum]|uniref:Uncharacterized protein n=1 Tax=Colletotrichum plurivorum TaxID=2175906 RepID=A0A8H6K9H6_9PEZI|nr:hypothetical protein CPLU01_09058 [Colletotrichum plurivorum]